MCFLNRSSFNPIAGPVRSRLAVERCQDMPHVYDSSTGNGSFREPLLWTRRGALRAGSAAVVASFAVAGCDILSTRPDSEDTGPEAAPEAKQAPMLARRVDAGELPPLEQRLPKNPLVVEPTEQTGVYGGEWNTALAGAADRVWLVRTIGYEQLVHWDLEFEKPVPNLVESAEQEDGGRIYIFRLRDGLKWSDGEAFTADDIVFWFEDVIKNDQLTPIVPSELVIGGELPSLEKVDELTFRFSFSEPYGLFLQLLATPNPGQLIPRYPRHYLEEFHQKYNENVDAKAKEEGFDDWVQLFGAKADLWANPDLPLLYAWTLTTALGEGSQVVAERNPYYFKTDPDGRQLPYLDRVVFKVVNDESAILLNATNGDLNMHVWHINSPTNKPVLARSRDDAGYRFFDVTFSWMNRMVIMLNLNHKDQQLRDVFQQKDFRIGLSHAIDREEMIKAIFQRQGEAWQAAPRPESDFFDEEFAKQYTEYDVALANEYLDRAGFSDRDGDGFRLRPDGKRIAFDVETPAVAAVSDFWPDALELVRGYWQAVGIDARVKVLDRALFSQHAVANEHDAIVWNGDGGLHDAILAPGYYFPHQAGLHWANAWANWYTGAGEPREEPPEAARRQMELYELVRATDDETERHEAFRQILQIAKEEFYCIGTVLPVGDYGIVANNFHNVAEPMIMAWKYPTPGPTRPEQYFISS